MVRLLHQAVSMRRAERGFSLIETLVATTIVIVGLSGLAQLFVVSSAANLGAKSASVATMLAQDKMEELIEQVELAGSGFDDSDYIDGHGRLLGTGGPSPPGTVYVRHWSIEPLSEGAAGPWVWQVSVARVGVPAGNEAARLVGVRTRRAP